MKFDIKRLLGWMIAIVVVSLTAVFIYLRSAPQTYALSIGDVSAYDVVASADVVDVEATNVRAADEAARIQMVMSRSENVSRGCLNLIHDFFALVDTKRVELNAENRSGATGSNGADSDDDGHYQLTEAQMTTAILELSEDVENKTSLRFEDDVYRVLLGSESSIYDSIKDKTESFAELIMAEKHDNISLNESISRQVGTLLESAEFYKESYEVVRPILTATLKANAFYDEDATLKAKEAAAAQVKQNPIMVPKGTRIVAVGDTITDGMYQQLLSLNLIDTGTFNYRFFISIVLLVILSLGVMYYYLVTFEIDQLARLSDRLTIGAIIAFPLLMSGWLTRISPLASPVAAATIVLTIYFRMRCAVVISVLLNLLVAPMTGNDPLFVVTSTATVIAAAILSEKFASRNRYAILIVGTALSGGWAALVYDLMTKSTLMKTGTDAGIAALAGGLSAVLAIGINPIIEVFLSSVSPMKLVELSQPSHPLLRKLFLEAPGTYQHCIMVSNLAETAADAVGANSLLVRVGAYYHDIGKTNNPYMFTENQADRNPHDNLSPEKSVEIILAHVQQGLNISRKYHLPLPVQRIIMEHHGNTLQAYFFDKAKRLAEANGEPAPDEAHYRYPWPIPTCKESAIVMLADSCEAAMKSLEHTDVNSAEALIRRIVKYKIDQDQLVSSGLSFQDVETIIQSFLQVYAGQFHKRVRYPGDQSDAKPATV
ncbi:MAG: HD family phosphohydrolase [Fastidiosipilaceae bacterium]|jgi:putative nucleotidyltransferase with HDIG domain